MNENVLMPSALREAKFLCDRLAEFERELLDDEVGTEFLGHVAPSAARLRTILEKSLSTPAADVVVAVQIIHSLLKDYEGSPSNAGDAFKIADAAMQTADRHPATAADGVEALRAVEKAMRRGVGGEILGNGWNITALNEARPLIHAALSAARDQGDGLE